MREIKFRLINKETNEIVGYEWLEDEGWKHSLPEKGIISNGVFHGMKVNKEFIRVQFTGLLDKNSKEIYEGDILKEYWKPCEDDTAVWGEYIGKIFYEDAGYWTKSKNHHHAITETYDSYEVIGNIFQNKDILDENSK